ncbi:MAG: universal stress protein [Chloroflexota bacterium]
MDTDSKARNNMATMNSKERILVPLDGSPAAEAAIPHAATLALVTSSVLRIVRVVQRGFFDPSEMTRTTASDYGHELHMADVRDAADYLATVDRRLEGEGVEVESAVLEGDPAQTLIHHAESDPAITMLAMTTHGRSGPGRWPLGSVTERVLANIEKPLLLVHPEGGIRIPPVYTYHLIVVPLDGSLLAESALDNARLLACSTGAALLLVAVVPSPDDIGRLPGGVHLPVSLDAWQAEVEEISCYLRRTARDMCGQVSGLAVQVRVVAGHPADAIIDMSDRTRADLIVMSTHGKGAQLSKGGQAHTWLGSVALRVVQGAHAPVLLLRAKELNDPSEWARYERLQQQCLDDPAIAPLSVEAR